MIGNLVVVKGYFYNLVGEVVNEFKSMDIVEVRVLHSTDTVLQNPLRTPIKVDDIYCASKSQIIKKSSRPVKMKQQLSLEEQQPTTL